MAADFVCFSLPSPTLSGGWASLKWRLGSALGILGPCVLDKLGGSGSGVACTQDFSWGSFEELKSEVQSKQWRTPKLSPGANLFTYISMRYMARSTEQVKMRRRKAAQMRYHQTRVKWIKSLQKSGSRIKTQARERSRRGRKKQNRGRTC